MKYKFYQTDYRLFATSSYGCRADFTENLSYFLENLGVKPIDKARPISNCLYERMLYYRLRYHTPVKTLAAIQTYQEMLETKKIEPLNSLQELALWFHNSVHIVGSPRNAELSADFAVGLMSPWLGEPDKFHKLICKITPENHFWPDGLMPDSEVLLDFDLAYVASPPPVLQRIIALQREECGLSDEEFKAERYEFFKNLSKKSQVFRTPSFQRYEGKARLNIEKALSDLSFGI